MDLDGDWTLISMGRGQHAEFPLWSKTGTVTISAGLRTDSKGQDGTTNMYAPKPTGGGVVQVLCDMKIIPRP